MRVQHKEKGQSIVLIVVSVFIMVVMAALMIDGGNMYLSRRAAQTAADAAALRGAYEYCVNEIAYPLSVVTEYATQQNNATAVENLTVNSSQLEVTVSLTNSTFFAKIFNKPTTTVQAFAAASCFNPQGVGDILPIAWSCHPPEGTPPGNTCEMQKIPVSVFKQLEGTFQFDTYVLDEGDGTTAASYQDGGSKIIYVVMDTDNFDPIDDCIEEGNGGTITCDFNGDGTYEVSGGADRGWLYLYDKPGADALKEVMESGLPLGTDATIDTWYAGKTGVANTVFDAAIAYREGDIALVPVFDAVCEDIDPKHDDFITECPAYNPATESYVEVGGNSTYYRVVAFAPFYVSCVAKNKDSCPGKDYAGIEKSTIEGYFLDGYVINGNPGGSFDLGVYILSLTE